MKQLMIKAEECLEKICDKVVLALGIVMFFALSYYSLRYTEKLLNNVEIRCTRIDTVQGNLLAFLGVFLLFSLVRFGLSRVDEKKLHMILDIVKIVTLVYVLGISVLWVSVSHAFPQADAKILCIVAELYHNGDYGSMIPVGYMSYNPHQYGLVIWLEGLYALFGNKHYMAFQYLNTVLLVLAVYAGYKLVELIFEKAVINIFYCMLVVACVPMFIYVGFVYGEIPSVSFCMVMMWCVVKYCKTGNRWAIPGIVISSVLAGMVRMNSLVVMIAAAIVLALCAMRKRRPQILIIIACMFLAVFATNNGIHKYYEYRSGNIVRDGIPHISYIMMGLQDTEKGPGWFNRANYESFESRDFDHEATKEADTEAVKMRLSELWSDKVKMLDFFRRKILTQWNAPDYNAIISLERFDCEFVELPRVVQSMFAGKLREFLENFMDRYQFVLYVCSFCVLLYSLKRSNPIENHILLIAIIGGLFFSAIWEAKSRYILPYMYFTIPLAAAGMFTLQEWCILLWGKVKNKKAMYYEEEQKEKTAA